MRRISNARATHHQAECPICRQPIRPGEEIARYEATEVGEDARWANHDHAACADREEIERYEEMYIVLDELSPREQQRYQSLNTALRRVPRLANPKTPSEADAA